MQKRFLLILLLTLIMRIAQCGAANFTGKCVGITDGDTIRVLKEGREIKVRLEGIDCPEKGQDFGTKSKKFTAGLVFGKMVKVNVVKIDKYGRSVARVSVDGRDVSLELVKAGLAWHYKHYSSDPVLAKAEAEAKAKKIGLWSTGHPVPPWEYRHGGAHDKSQSENWE